MWNIGEFGREGYIVTKLQNDPIFDERIEVMVPKAMKEGIKRLATAQGNKPSSLLRAQMALLLDRAFGDTWHAFGSEQELTDDSQ